MSEAEERTVGSVGDGGQAVFALACPSHLARAGGVPSRSSIDDAGTVASLTLAHPDRAFETTLK